MYDRYLIVPESLRSAPGGSTGFTVDVRIPYYRGLGLSMVEDVAVTVDGHTYPRSAVTFTVHGNSYSLDDLEEVFDDRWPFTEAATITVSDSDGLAASDHRVEVAVRLRISYHPGPSTTRDVKTLLLVG